MSCAGKWDYISIRGKPWDRRTEWLGEGVKSKHKGTSPLHCKVTASAKPEMKPDSFNKMSISPRRVERFKDLGKSRLRRPKFWIVRIHEMSRAPLALQYFANITAAVSSRVCGFINGKKKLHHRQVCAGTEILRENRKTLVQPKGLYFIRLPREPKVILSSKPYLLGKAFRCVATSEQCQDRAQETSGVHAYFVWMKFLTVIPSLQVSRVTICISRALAPWEPCLALSCLA